MSRNAIEVIGVSKNFGTYQALKSISFEIRRNEFFTMLGPSGCGKTTLLRMLAGFESPDDGTILLNGAEVVDIPPHKRRVNTVFQSYALYPHMTVAENIWIRREPRGAFGLVDHGRMNRQTQELFDRLNIRLDPAAIDRKSVV